MKVLEYPNTKLGNFLKKKQISRNQLAKSTGFSPQYIGVLVKGGINPTVEKARIIADALFTNIDKIF